MKSIICRVAQAALLCCVLVSAPAAFAAGYYAQDGKLFTPEGQELPVRGISHFGFNADILQPQYLWAMGWKEQIAQMKALGFNAIRVPFTPDTLYVTTPVDQLSYVDRNKNPELPGKTPLQVLDLWMAEANRQGMFVMLDFHSVTNKRLYPQWFTEPGDHGLTWNQQAYTKDHWTRDLKFVAARYAHLPYFFAMDVYNEPNGRVRWSTGDSNQTNPAYYWKLAAESAAAAVLSANPRLLIFVQGINGNYDGIENSNIPMNWGEDFQPQAYQPLNIPYDKLVLSPHTYGPDVYMKSSFSAPDFPNNLRAHWETLFGKFHPQHPVVISEWGGKYGNGTGGQQDVTWQNALVDYLLSKGIRDSFYWCYTPNSGDTGGILDDNLNVREDKMALLRRHWAPGSTPAPAPAPEPAPEPAPAPAPEPAPAPAPAPAPEPAPAPTPVTNPQIVLESASYAVTQGTRYVYVRVRRLGNAKGYAAVRYATANGTAASGRDYSARSGLLSWSSGNTKTRTISIPISNAVAFSGTRAFSIALTNPVGTTLGTPRSATVTITGRATSPAPAPTTEPAPAPTNTSYPQPYIQSFSPASGPVGTVVTFSGSGFTGLNNAWVGESRSAVVQVVSDTVARVTIPADGTTGSIGLFNPAGKVSFSATAFTVNR